MKSFALRRPALLPLLVLLGFGLIQCDQSTRNSETSITYERSDELFANPERGIYVRYSTTPGGPIFDPDELLADRNEHITQIGRAYNIDDFIDRDFTPEFLDQIEADFRVARDAGVKTHPRFRYTRRMGDPDAPLEQVLRHIDQLEPVFSRNYDVISFIQAGFIGAWGEWHASTNDLERPENMRAVLFQLLDVLHEDRTVVVRSPRHKMNIFETNHPITIDQAFDGSRISRAGHHNDCFLADETDVGTYVPHVYPVFDREEDHSIESIKAYLHEENRYMPMGGETCNPRPGVTDRYSCETALEEMDYLHWSYLHRDYSRQILDHWEEQGCMPEIERRLGYRLYLQEGSFSNEVQPGGSLRFSLTLKNEGFASPYNPRDVVVVLRDSENPGIVLKIALPDDPRYWFGGEAVALEHQIDLPSDLPEGRYDLLFSLPDPTNNLQNRPEYAIRLGNRDVWEADTGFNRLHHQLTVTNDRN